MFLAQSWALFITPIRASREVSTRDHIIFAAALSAAFLFLIYSIFEPRFARRFYSYITFSVLLRARTYGDGNMRINCGRPYPFCNISNPAPGIKQIG